MKLTVTLQNKIDKNVLIKLRGFDKKSLTEQGMKECAENNKIVFKYAKSMKHPGPAKNYKKQDLNSRSSSNWGWLYAYASRFPDHENVQRLKQWSQDKSKLNSYQWDIVHHYLNIGNRPFGSASWTVVEANCHFTK